MADQAIPDLAKHVALSELLYIAEGTALDDPKTAKFCVKRIQQITTGDTVPFLLKPNVFKEKLEKVMRMLKNDNSEAREMASTPKGIKQDEVM